MNKISITEAGLICVAQQQIQKIMITLDEKLSLTGRQIDTVSVDTRNFANMKTEIHLRPTPEPPK